MEIVRLILSIIILIFVIVLFFTALAGLILRIPFVPSNKKSVKKMIEIADLKKGQKVYDLGCGDARIITEATKKGTTAIGYELAPLAYILGYLRIKLTNSSGKILFQDFFKANLKDADVIFCYLTPEPLSKLLPKFQKECKKGTKIISNTFKIKDLEPIQKIDKPKLYIYEI